MPFVGKTISQLTEVPELLQGDATFALEVTGTTYHISFSGFNESFSNKIDRDVKTLSSAGEYHNGSRILLNAYGTGLSATAGNIVNFGGTNVSNVGSGSGELQAGGMLTVVTDAGINDELVVEGIVKLSTNSGWSTAKLGTKVYLGSTAGTVQTTAPTTIGEFVRIVGYVISGSNAEIYFKPDNTYIQL